MVFLKIYIYIYKYIYIPCAFFNLSYLCMGHFFVEILPYFSVYFCATVCVECVFSVNGLFRVLFDVSIKCFIF